MTAITKEIKLPMDHEGFTSFQCYYCRERFQLLGSQIDEKVHSDLTCPSCGLTNNQGTFYTDELAEVALQEAMNMANEVMLQAFSNKPAQTHKTKAQPVKPLVEVGLSEPLQLNCCRVSLKTKPLVTLLGLYCPFCGEYLAMNTPNPDSNELKKVSREFQLLSRRLLNTTYDDAEANIQRFTDFVEDTPLLGDFIRQNIAEYADKSENKRFDVKSAPDGTVEIPTDKMGEIATVWYLLEWVADKEHELTYFALMRMYSSAEFDVATSKLCKRLLHPFVDHLALFLTGELSSAGVNTNQMQNININAPNNNVNVANSMGDNNQVLNQGVDFKEFESVLKTFTDLLEKSDIDPEVKEELGEDTEFLLEQAKAEKPKKNLVQRSLKRLAGFSKGAKQAKSTSKDIAELSVLAGEAFEKGKVLFDSFPI